MVDILVDKMLCGRYLVNFVVVDIYYNPTGRSEEGTGEESHSVYDGLSWKNFENCSNGNGF